MSLDKRGQALTLLREHAAERTTKVGARQAHVELMAATRVILDDFRMQHDLPGVRYWENYDGETGHVHDRTHHTTFIKPFDDLTPPGTVTAEVSRMEFFARQGATGYDDLL